MPEPADGKAPRRPKAPKGLPPYLASLYEVPLLDREQEMHLFRKMNYLKHKLSKLREQMDSSRIRVNDLQMVETLTNQYPHHLQHLLVLSPERLEMSQDALAKGGMPCDGQPAALGMDHVLVPMFILHFYDLSRDQVFQKV